MWNYNFSFDYMMKENWTKNGSHISRLGNRNKQENKLIIYYTNRVTRLGSCQHKQWSKEYSSKLHIHLNLSCKRATMINDITPLSNELFKQINNTFQF